MKFDIIMATLGILYTCTALIYLNSVCTKIVIMLA